MNPLEGLLASPELVVRTITAVRRENRAAKDGTWVDWRSERDAEIDRQLVLTIRPASCAAI